MQEFMLLFRNHSGDGRYAVSLEDMQAAMPKWQEWIGNIAAQGKFVGTQPLEYEGKLVRANHHHTDGPYVELKEIVVGYLTCKADSLDDAAALCAGCPILDYPGGSVEVRPITPYNV